MLFDDKYKAKLALYKRGRSNGPSTYTYKKDGFRLNYLGGAWAPCFFCGKKTPWGVTYFYPEERFKDWKKRDVNTFRVCKEEELPLLKAQIVENKINNINMMHFVPRTKKVRKIIAALKKEGV